MFVFIKPLKTNKLEKNNRKKDANKPMVFGYEVKYRDSLDLLSKVLNIHTTLTNLNKSNVTLRPKLIDVLSFYLLFGFSEATKGMVLESLSITKKNLNQINSELTKKGFLIRDSRNFRKLHLSPTIKQIRDYFTKNKKKMAFLIPFKMDLS